MESDELFSELLQYFTSEIPDIGDTQAKEVPENLISDSQVSQFTNDTTDKDVERALGISYEVCSVRIPSCEKKRGENFFVNNEKKNLTTKKCVPVPLYLNCGRNINVRISERYSDASCKGQPVICESQCKLELLLKGEMKNLDLYKESFIITKQGNGAPDIMRPNMNSDFPFVLLEGIADSTDKISIIFRCRNTCETHKRFNKNRDLLIEFIDKINGSVVCSDTFSVRVCESPRRDQKSLKRKMSSPMIKQEVRNYATADSFACSSIIPVKTTPTLPDEEIILHLNENEISSSLQTYVTGNENQKMIVVSSDFIKTEDVAPPVQFTPTKIIAKMKSKRDENAVIQLIKNLGGELF